MTNVGMGLIANALGMNKVILFDARCQYVLSRVFIQTLKILSFERSDVCSLDAKYLTDGLKRNTVIDFVVDSMYVYSG